MRQYRIKEVDGEFFIEASYERVILGGGLFRNKRKVEVRWSELNINHELWDLVTHEDIILLLDPFTTKYQAVTYINSEILKPTNNDNRPKYHYTDNFKDVNRLQVKLKKPSGGSTYEVP